MSGDRGRQDSTSQDSIEQDSIGQGRALSVP